MLELLNYLTKITFSTLYNLVLHKIFYNSCFNLRENRKYLDEGNVACVIFVDLEKVFDTVEHDILIKKA